MAKENKDRTPLLIGVSLFGLLALIVISSVFQFNNRVFQAIYPKSRSLADVNSLIPGVDLKVSYNNELTDGVVDTTIEKTPLTLKWETKGNPSSCVGRSWGTVDMDKTWDGPKDPKGGSFVTRKLNVNNPYVYSIDCFNSTGDSSGDSVTINIGAQPNSLVPYITSLKLVTSSGKTYDSKEVISLNKNELFNIHWSSLNTDTPYSVCISSGSFPIGYKNVTASTVSDTYSVQTKKIHKFNVYCSNETSLTQNSLTIFVN